MGAIPYAECQGNLGVCMYVCVYVCGVGLMEFVYIYIY